MKLQIEESMHIDLHLLQKPALDWQVTNGSEIKANNQIGLLVITNIIYLLLNTEYATICKTVCSVW